MDSISRVALITGAFGGLGQALVSEFAAQGWRVAAGWHRAARRQEIERVWPVKLDVTDQSGVNLAVRQLIERWGRVDLLINNAGCTADQLAWQISDNDWQRVVDVNLKGAFLCSQAAVRPMLKQRSGHIINLASVAGRQGARGQSSYAAAKAGLIGLTQTLALELGARNIRVNAVLPGVLPTPMTAKLTAAQLATFRAANALGRLNAVAEVARFLAFLASTENISGQSFQLDSRIGRWT